MKKQVQELQKQYEQETRDLQQKLDDARKTITDMKGKNCVILCQSLVGRIDFALSTKFIGL